MRPLWRTTRCPHPTRSGFSIIEAVMVLMLVLVVVGSMLPTVQRVMRHSRVNRAAGVASADFYLAQSLAARARQPIKIEVDATAKTVELRLYSTDSLLHARQYAEGEFALEALSASPVTILVLPNGMASATITLSLGASATFQRQVKMSRAGQIRIIRN